MAEGALMVGTVNGVGTAYYGCRDERPDGSYITTEFAVFADIPLWPIRSLRVRPVGSRRVVRRGIFVREKFTSQSYEVAHVPLNGRQIFNVYLFVVCLFGSPVALYYFFGDMLDALDFITRKLGFP